MHISKIAVMTGTLLVFGAPCLALLPALLWAAMPSALLALTYYFIDGKWSSPIKEESENGIKHYLESKSKKIEVFLITGIIAPLIIILSSPLVLVCMPIAAFLGTVIACLSEVLLFPGSIILSVTCTAALISKYFGYWGGHRTGKVE